MTDALPTISDQALVAAARAGVDGAWTEIETRHRDAVRSVAEASGRDGGHVIRAMEALHRDVLEPATDAAGTLALRPRAIADLTGGHYGPVPRGADAPPWPAAAVEQEYAALAVAFSGLPELWQTVLWHRYVEQATAAATAVHVGRSPASVVALEQTASRGLFDAYGRVVTVGPPPPTARCRPVISELGAYRRATLPAAQARSVETHVADCPDCHRRLSVGEQLPTLVPAAIAPALTGMGVEEYRQVLGVPAVVGASVAAAHRARRSGRRSRVLGVVAVAVALLAAALLIRGPFGDLEPRLAGLVDEAIADGGPTTTIADIEPVPSTTQPVADTRLPSRIEFVFPATPQGAVYVPGGRPLDISVSLSTPGPVLEGATGTVDALLTNNDSVRASVGFFIRASEGFAFEAMTEGDGTCRAEDDDGATCSVSIGPGATASMSLRFAVGGDVPDRLVVDPGVSPSLEVPVMTVPDLVIGVIGRVDSRLVGATFDSNRSTASADLELDSGAVVEQAVLVWEGETSSWSESVTLYAGEGSAGQRVDATSNGTVSAAGPAPFRSVADVTEMVAAELRDDPSVRYTVERPPGDHGPGSWTLVVVATEPSAPRRLVVVAAPSTSVTPTAPLSIEVPVAGSARSFPGGQGRLAVQHRVGDGDVAITASPTSLGESRELGDTDGGGHGVDSYDLDIDPTDALLVVASSETGDARVTAVALTLDLAS